MSVITRTLIRGLSSAPRLAAGIGRALNRSVSSRYEERRALLDRTGCGGLI